jgi:hypothetical protein
MIEIPEQEWRKIRDMKDIVLDRACKKILIALRDKISISSADMVNHEKYLEIYSWIDDQDQKIGNGFDGLRRSTAYALVSHWVINRWLTILEFNRFSEDTRAKVLFLAGLDKYAPPEII